jgi:hypothetical protein
MRPVKREGSVRRISITIPTLVMRNKRVRKLIEK